jgi:uncharacterized YigZ family protein
MEVDSFFTLAGASEGAFKKSGSRFLAFAFPVHSEDEIKNHLAALRQKYFDARHHCYAWVLGPNKLRFRAFDDGEPGHSAGTPILGQIHSKKLTNVLVVVVRYFGGVKLGVGGLIQAYKAAAADALNKARITEQPVMFEYEVRYPYEETPVVMKLVKDFELIIYHRDFNEQSILKVGIMRKWNHDFGEKIALLNALGHPISVQLLKNSSS